MNEPKIKRVTALEGMRLCLEYENGEVRLFDVTPYAMGTWFGALKDARYFRTVHVLPDGSGIEWQDGQDIAPHELYDCSIAV